MRDGPALGSGPHCGGHVLPHLVVVGADGGPHHCFDTIGIRELSDGGVHHPRRHATPPRVHHGDGSRRRVDEGQGNAVRGQDRDRNVR